MAEIVRLRGAAGSRSLTTQPAEVSRFLALSPAPGPSHQTESPPPPFTLFSGGGGGGGRPCSCLLHKVDYGWTV